MKQHATLAPVRRVVSIGLFICCAVMLLFSVLRSEDRRTDVTSQTYLTSKITSQFDSIFRTDDQKHDFNKLREFLREKSDLVGSLVRELGLVADRTVDIAAYSHAIARMSAIVQGKNDQEQVSVPKDLISPMLYRVGGSRVDASMNEGGEGTGEALIRAANVRIIIADDSSAIVQLHAETAKQRTVQANITAVRQDVDDCTNAIEAALTPEYAEHQFRVSICSYFAALIAVVLFLFFAIVYRRSDSSLSKELLSGTGLQFITLFVLIIAVILFGILGILKGSELAAILSGISGYILGKGTARAPGIPAPPTNGKSSGNPTEAAAA